MEKTVVLSIQVSRETRKILKKMATDKEVTMAKLVEEMIMLRWNQNTTSNNKNGII